MRRLLAAALAGVLLGSTAGLAGCVALAVGGIAGATLVVTDRRSPTAILDDTAIEARVNGVVFERHGDRVHVNATSFNGVVLLTGEVPDEATRSAIDALARATDRVRSVQNELAVMPASSLADRAQDAYLTSAVKTRLLEVDDLFAASYVKVVTERTIVYLMGMVTQTEAGAAARVAASTRGVSRVVTVFEYIE